MLFYILIIYKVERIDNWHTTYTYFKASHLMYGLVKKNKAIQSHTLYEWNLEKINT